MLTDEATLLLLPRPILINSILSEYLDLPSLIRVSSASRECRRIVFEEVPSSKWSEIDLCGNDGVTDEQLAALLTNVNARENTRVLSLVGCVNVTGTGLEPLRGSTVLEDLDLRVLGSLPLTGESGKLNGPTGLNEDFVAGILRSMLPVRSDDGDYGNEYNRSQNGDGYSIGIVLHRVAIRPYRDPRCDLPGTEGQMAIIRSMFGPYDASDRGSPLRYESAALQKVNREHDILARPHRKRHPLYHDGIYPTDARWIWEHTCCSVCLVQSRTVEPNDLLECAECRKHYCKACALPLAPSECEPVKCQWCRTGNLRRDDFERLARMRSM